MKVKVRISHFTTKSIPINQFTTTQVVSVQSKETAAKESDINKRNQQVQSNTRVKATKKSRPNPRKLVKIEAKYASKPKKQVSKIIKKKIWKEVVEFRQVSKEYKIKSSCDKFKNGQIKENSSTCASISH